jgi:hypothetical protein
MSARTPKLITVTATAKGHYGRLYRPGDVFEVFEHLFADRWMVKGSTTDAVLAKRGSSPKDYARQEALASGGANAALTTALADLKDAAEREAALLARIAELEAMIAAGGAEKTEGAPDAAAAEPDAAPEETPTEEPVGEAEPPATAPVQRVRRTAASS